MNKPSGLAGPSAGTCAQFVQSLYSPSPRRGGASSEFSILAVVKTMSQKEELVETLSMV
jgi:hypothetical protein